jgi:hypothetical protein
MESTKERFARLEVAVAYLRKEKDGKHANHVGSCTWMFSLR